MLYFIYHHLKTTKKKKKLQENKTTGTGGKSAYENIENGIPWQ